MSASLARSRAENPQSEISGVCGRKAAAFGGGFWVWGALLSALTLAACTPIDKVESKSSGASRAPVDFDDLWVAAGYPCGGNTIPLLLRVEQMDTKLTAISLMRSECSEYGERVWQGTLPHAPILRSELPTTFAVELTVGADKPHVRGTGTVVSTERMLLDVGTTPLIVTRAEAAVAAVDGTGGAAARSGTASGDAGERPIASGVRDGGVELDAGHDAASPKADDKRARAGRGGGGGSGERATSDSGTASSGAADDATDPSSRDWYCLSYEGSCTCVADLGMSADMCDTPKPSCCFQLVAAGQPSCQCWPTDSEPCRNRESEAPGSTLVATCPPP